MFSLNFFKAVSRCLCYLSRQLGQSHKLEPICLQSGRVGAGKEPGEGCRRPEAKVPWPRPTRTAKQSSGSGLDQGYLLQALDPFSRGHSLYSKPPQHFLSFLQHSLGRPKVSKAVIPKTSEPNKRNSQKYKKEKKILRENQNFTSVY